MISDFRCLSIAVTSLLLALVTAALSLLGNWIAGDGSPNASVGTVLAVTLVAWGGFATALAAAQARHRAARARDNHLPRGDRVAPRVGRELGVLFLISLLGVGGLARTYLRDDLGVLTTMVQLGSWMLLAVLGVLGVRAHWRWSRRDTRQSSPTV